MVEADIDAIVQVCVQLGSLVLQVTITLPEDICRRRGWKDGVVLLFGPKDQGRYLHDCTPGKAARESKVGGCPCTWTMDLAGRMDRMTSYASLLWKVR